jgi:integrase
MNIWTIDEFTRFIDKVKSRKHKLFFSVLYFTGLRLGEALALKWADLNDESISVNKSITRKTNKGSFEIKEPKTTSSIRNVKVNKSLYLSLINFKTDEMKCESFKEDWFIFNREKPLSQSHLDRVKDRAIAEADLKRIRIHDLRHSHASNLISESISIVAASRRLGHSNIDMTLRVYTHLLEKNDEQLINFIEDSSHNLLTTI